jgi:type IV secretory pathway TrbL component
MAERVLGQRDLERHQGTGAGCRHRHRVDAVQPVHGRVRRAAPSIDDAMAIVLAALSLLGLGIFGPGIANGLVSGGPQLSALALQSAPGSRSAALRWLAAGAAGLALPGRRCCPVRWGRRRSWRCCGRWRQPPPRTAWALGQTGAGGVAWGLAGVAKAAGIHGRLALASAGFIQCCRKSAKPATLKARKPHVRDRQAAPRRWARSAAASSRQGCFSCVAGLPASTAWAKRMKRSQPMSAAASRPSAHAVRSGDSPWRRLGPSTCPEATADERLHAAPLPTTANHRNLRRLTRRRRKSGTSASARRACRRRTGATWPLAR